MTTPTAIAPIRQPRTRSRLDRLAITRESFADQHANVGERKSWKNVPAGVVSHDPSPIVDPTRERSPPALVADLIHQATGRVHPRNTITSSRAPRASSRGPLAEPRQRDAQLDAALITDLAVPDRLADPRASPDSHAGDAQHRQRGVTARTDAVPLPRGATARHGQDGRARRGDVNDVESATGLHQNEPIVGRFG